MATDPDPQLFPVGQAQAVCAAAAGYGRQEVVGTAVELVAEMLGDWPAVQEALTVLVRCGEAVECDHPPMIDAAWHGLAHDAYLASHQVAVERMTAASDVVTQLHDLLQRTQATAVRHYRDAIDLLARTADGVVQVPAGTVPPWPATAGAQPTPELLDGFVDGVDDLVTRLQDAFQAQQAEIRQLLATIADLQAGS